MVYTVLHQVACIAVVMLVVMLVASTHSLPMKENTILAEQRSLVKRSIRVSSDPTEQTVVEGHTIEMRCEAHGSTPPIIHWLFRGELLEQSPLDHMAENLIPPLNPGETSVSTSRRSFFTHTYYSVSTLIIKDASSSNDGEYTCVADLPGDRDTESYNINVTPSAQFARRSELSASEEETRIYLYTESVMEFENVTTRLICRATQGASRPAPEISWSINGVIIDNALTNFKIELNGDLKIYRTDRYIHLASIKCTALGDYGKSAEVEPFVYIYEAE